MRDIPQLLLYKQDKKTCLGAVTGYSELTEDIRFNSCSELSFTLPQKYYDTDKEQWLDNPVYNDIEKHKLLFFGDDKKYFSFPPRGIGDSTYYKYKDTLPPTLARSDDSLRFSQNPCLEHFEVQDEVELFDIGRDAGYAFKHFCRIGDGSYGDNAGCVVDYSNRHWSEDARQYNPYLAEDAFIPVAPTDVIAYKTGVCEDNVSPIFKWRIATYTNDDAGSFVEESDTNMWHIDSTGSARHIINSKGAVLSNGGYCRVWYANSNGSSKYNYESRECSWTIPISGFAKVYSGERRCTKIDNLKDDHGWYIGSDLSPKMRWFVIVSVEEGNNGIICKKNVTAYSYEYTLCNTTFSLSGDTLPLYIPDAISNLINGSNWIIDYVSNRTPVRKAQLIKKGVLNELLSYLPNWHIGYVSSSLMTTYRKLNDADAIDVYSYLIDTIQSTYNCFIVFDNDNMTISAYSLNDINSLESSLHLTWDNAIKSFKKSNMDASYFTALRVKAGDGTYGAGLVNPTGNEMIYNFDRIKPELKYEVSGRLLSNAITAWVTEYNNQMLSEPEQSNNYQTLSKSLIRLNIELIKSESAFDMALENYLAVKDKINIMLSSDNEARLPERPMTEQAILSHSASRYHNAALQAELANAAKEYAKAKDEFSSIKQDFENTQNSLRSISRKLTFNYKRALLANGGDPDSYNAASTTILSANEIKEITKYIVEGTWNFDDISFSETYGVDDIYDTLRGVLVEAQNDLGNRLSITNFDFSIDSVNVSAVKEFEDVYDSLYLGHKVYLHIENGEGILTPILLSMHINYKDPTDFNFTFTTDTRRKPLQFRFADLYNTIAQTSVTDTTFSFDQ